jgi:hypothetical protein
MKKTRSKKSRDTVPLNGMVVARETRDGWLLLTAETEANGGSKGTYEGGPSLVGLLGSFCQFKKF